MACTCACTSTLYKCIINNYGNDLCYKTQCMNGVIFPWCILCVHIVLHVLTVCAIVPSIIVDCYSYPRMIALVNTKNRPCQQKRYDTSLHVQYLSYACRCTDGWPISFFTFTWNIFPCIGSH